MKSPMKCILVLTLLMSPRLCAQDAVYFTHSQTAVPAGAIASRQAVLGPSSLVRGAPYSATITEQLIRTLADGTHIVQISTGSAARDSEGRTRQDPPLPTVDDPSVIPPRLAFIQDPITQTAYILNLGNKTVQKAAMPSAMKATPGASNGPTILFAQTRGIVKMDESSEDERPVVQSAAIKNEKAISEDLGSQTMEGLLVNGVRTTQIIPAGEIGNSTPIKVLMEVWTSPELKAVIYSKLTDPRTGDHIFQLTGIVRSEPDPSLFTVPADFEIVDVLKPMDLDEQIGDR